MTLVDTESRSRVGIDWYDDELEAEVAGRRAQADPGAVEASIGYIQVGRDRGLDRTVNGQRQYAVVVP